MILKLLYLFANRIKFIVQVDHATCKSSSALLIIPSFQAVQERTNAPRIYKTQDRPNAQNDNNDTRYVRMFDDKEIQPLAEKHEGQIYMIQDDF